MLILTRNPEQSLRIGEDVSVVVLGVEGNEVRIGITAPSHVSVHREEIYRRIQSERANNLGPVRNDNEEAYHDAPLYSAEREPTQQKVKKPVTIKVKRKFRSSMNALSALTK